MKLEIESFDPVTEREIIMSNGIHLRHSELAQVVMYIMNPQHGNMPYNPLYITTIHTAAKVCSVDMKNISDADCKATIDQLVESGKIVRIKFKRNDTFHSPVELYILPTTEVTFLNQNT